MGQNSSAMIKGIADDFGIFNPNYAQRSPFLDCQTVVNWNKFGEKAAGYLLGIADQLIIKGSRPGINPLKKAFYSLSNGIIVTLVKGIYYYTRNPVPNVVEQANPPAYPDHPVQYRWDQKNQQIIENPVINDDNDFEGIQNLEWSRIEMTQRQFDDIKQLTRQEEFIELAKSLTCPLSKQIMRQPCKMKCCIRKYGKHEAKCAEKQYLQFKIKKTEKCVLCKSPATFKDVEVDLATEVMIDGLRNKAFKTYKTLSESQKSIWKDLFDSYFGKNYTEKYMKNEKIV